jgi:hypothetical protein
MSGVFPQFTPHSIDHLDAVVANLDWIIPENVKDVLNEYELFALLSAAYLHDIGMVPSIPEKPLGSDYDAFVRDYEQKNHETSPDDMQRLYIRKYHHLRSQSYIAEEGARLGLGTDVSLWSIVGRIAAGHRVENLGDKQRFGIAFLSSATPIHRDLLAAYLRLADELDISAQRTPLLSFEAIDPHQPALAHWQAHLSTFGVGPSRDAIVANAECRSLEVHTLLRDLEQKTQETLEQVLESIPQPYRFANGYIAELPIPFSRVRFEIEPIGYKAWNLAFEFDRQSMADILTSPLLYGDRTSAIRELIQNSVDACRVRRNLEPMMSQYRPSISVKVFGEERSQKLVITDNGVGMSEHTVRHYLGRVGNSFYRSSEFKDYSYGMQPIGRFGIGLVSSFMIAEQLNIRTQRNGFDGVAISIENPTSIFRVTDYSSSNPGTDIELSLHKDIKLNYDDVAKYAPCLEIPISVEINGVENLISPNEELTIDWLSMMLGEADLSEVGQRKREEILEKCEFHSVRVESEDMIIVLGMVFPNPLYIGEESKWQYRWRGIKVCNQGILIEDGSRLGVDYDKDFYRDMYWRSGDSRPIFRFPFMGYVNFTRHPQALAFSRDRLLESEWTRGIERKIKLSLVESIGVSVRSALARFQGNSIGLRKAIYGYLVYGIFSGFISTDAGMALQSYLSPDSRNDSRFSVDTEITDVVSEIYGEYYPVAWKQGAFARFETLSSVLTSRPQVRRIHCCLADPMYPNFRGFSGMESDIEITAVLDDPREFELISRFVASRSVSCEVVMQSGISIHRMSGTQIGLDDAWGWLPIGVRAASGASLDSDTVLVVTEQRLVHKIARFGLYWLSDPITDPTDPALVLLNMNHPLVVWLGDIAQRSQYRLLAQDIVRRLLAAATVYIRLDDAAIGDNVALERSDILELLSDIVHREEHVGLMESLEKQLADTDLACFWVQDRNNSWTDLEFPSSESTDGGEKQGVMVNVGIGYDESTTGNHAVRMVRMETVVTRDRQWMVGLGLSDRVQVRWWDAVLSDS